jgi:hypothetical protein
MGLSDFAMAPKKLFQLLIDNHESWLCEAFFNFDDAFVSILLVNSLYMTLL